MLNRCVMVALTAFAFVPASPPMHATQSNPPACKPAGSMVQLESLAEASGLAVSRSTPGRLWAHNDSGKPEITALDEKGTAVGRVSLSGATVEDWEGMASAPCGDGSCLFIGDIGDNEARRKEIRVYRVPEPADAGGSAAVDRVLRASYPDGAHDAEALLAAPNGSLYVVTKGETGPIALYKFPQDGPTGGTMRLERVGEPLSQRAGAAMRVTDGAVSPDGAWVVLRTSAALTFYRAPEFFKGDFRPVRRTDLKSIGEPQGEAVAFGPSINRMYVAGEGGGKKQPGTLAVLSCGL
jgi:hypothetical protein